MKRPHKDIPSRTRDIDLISQECGRETAEKLVEKMGSMRLYIPSPRRALADARRKYILRCFNGSNHRELAAATGYSIRRVYDILKGL